MKILLTDRDEFIGSHVTWLVKEALQAEAQKRGISVSALIFTILRSKLKKLGHRVESTND